MKKIFILFMIFILSSCWLKDNDINIDQNTNNLNSENISEEIKNVSSEEIKIVNSIDNKFVSNEYTKECYNKEWYDFDKCLDDLSSVLTKGYFIYIWENNCEDLFNIDMYEGTYKQDIAKDFLEFCNNIYDISIKEIDTTTNNENTIENCDYYKDKSSESYYNDIDLWINEYQKCRIKYVLNNGESCDYFIENEEKDLCIYVKDSLSKYEDFLKEKTLYQIFSSEF